MVIGEQICAAKEVRHPAVTQEGEPFVVSGLTCYSLIFSKRHGAHTALGIYDASQRSGRGEQLMCIKTQETPEETYVHGGFFFFMFNHC